MSVSYQCAFYCETHLVQLVGYLNEILALNLKENENKNAYFGILNLKEFDYDFFLTYQDHLENDCDLDFENYNVLLNITLLNKYDLEKQKVLMVEFFMELLEHLVQKDQTLTRAMTVYDVQAVLFKWHR